MVVLLLAGLGPTGLTPTPEHGTTLYAATGGGALGAAEDGYEPDPVDAKNWTPALDTYKQELTDQGWTDIQVNSDVYRVVAEPMQIYAPGATISVVVPNGTDEEDGYHTVPKPASEVGGSAFTGTLDGYETSDVHLYVSEDYISGFLDTGLERIEVDTLGNRTSAHQFIYYQTASKLPDPEDPTLNAPAPPAPEEERDREPVPQPPAITGVTPVDAATQGDPGPDRPVYHVGTYSFWQNSPDAADEITTIATRANDNAYAPEVGWQVLIGDIDIITWQTSWQQETDEDALLTTFAKDGTDGTEHLNGWCISDAQIGTTGDYRNEHHIGTCHMWTWTDFDGQEYGVANGQFCGQAGSLTTHAMDIAHNLEQPTRTWVTAEEKSVIFAHEVGHNWAAVHEDADLLFGDGWTIMYQSQPFESEVEDFSADSEVKIQDCSIERTLSVNPWIDVRVEHGAELSTSSWGSTGLWHVTQGRTHTGSNAWWYGQEATGDYDTGSPNSGALTSSWISMPDSMNPVQLWFWSWDESEDGSYDNKMIEFRTCSTCGWTVLGEVTGPENAWEEYHYPIPGVQGGDLQIRFYFDTVDAALNHYEGWYIDDIRLVS